MPLLPVYNILSAVSGIASALAAVPTLTTPLVGKLVASTSVRVFCIVVVTAALNVLLTSPLNVPLENG